MPSRYVRVIAAVADDGAVLEELGPRVPWLARLAIYPHGLKLVSHPRFVDASLIGLDAASASACEALDVWPGHAVLDLCCAPGGKLSALAELMEHQGSLVGVDVSETRLNTTRAVLRKYRVAKARDGWNFALMLQDGRVFDPVQASGDVAWSCDMDTVFFCSKQGDARKHANASMRKLLSRAPKPALPTTFDRVLVDAECSTDARTLPPDCAYKKPRKAPVDIVALQTALLRRGFELLKPGGALVYATCSRDDAQNERVIADFLARTPDARAVEPDQLANAPAARGTLIPQARLFSPQASDTSGLFLCKLEKHKPLTTGTPSAESAST